ncbi:Protein of unknown function [Paraoerskovia marina]|uniref:DUF3043 domain-containing protein n=1 Tax=Paraoerskovia marina TaxID=545619 RepID=A0A1H1S6N0_9CELL|nr:Protein of unknown function [Paraoerskovia marina]
MTPDVEPVSATDGAISGKGRPTPKRKQAEAANKRPLVPNDRRAAAKASKEKNREARLRQQHALQTGDERYLPPRDKGPQRRYVRDYVDARWNLGEYFLFIAMLSLVGMIVTSAVAPSAATIIVVVLYALVLATILDAVFMWRGLKRKLLAKFDDVPSGTMMYAVTRAFQIRRARLPKPQHKKHGHYPA